MQNGYSSVVNDIKKSVAVVFSIDANNAVLGKGSGFIYNKKGLLVTCNHVVDNPSASVVLKFPDREDFIGGKIVLRDEEHDLALIKFDSNDREPLTEVDAKMVKEGMPVVFSGYPLDLMSLTTHQGILSAIIKDAAGVTTYLIDGTVNRGNSGCPLTTEDGKVIGVVNAQRREQADLLKQVENLKIGAISLHGLDLVQIYKAIIDNLQLGIGYAVPSSYIPKHQGPDIKLDLPVQKKKLRI